MIERKFWHPELTSQYMICPIPYHMDTYRGCSFNCKYCFARDFVVFSRRNSKNKEFTHLIGNRPDLLRKWIKRASESEIDPSKGHIVAFKERIPIKIGATADPFPPIEEKERITIDTLHAFHEIDYPIQMSTKNPEMLYKFIDEFEKPNWTLNVTLTTVDEKLAKIIEPSAPSPKKRLEAIKKITNKGVPVFVRIQPLILPHMSYENKIKIVEILKEAGVWGFNTEALKIRIIMPEEEQALFKEIGDYFNMDLRAYYKTQDKTGTDYELTTKIKKEYSREFWELAKRYGLKYFPADNHIGCIGDGDECCGTQVLHDYKVWGNNERTKSFNTVTLQSSELGKVLVNFGRSEKYKDKTLDEVVDLKTDKQGVLFEMD